MIGIWIVFGTLAALAGLRYRARLRSARADALPPRVDDEALRQILEHGVLRGEDEDPLDLEEAARAEEEFWSDSWDEPEEYPR